MEAKQKAVRHTQQNKKDIEGLKRISRSLLKFGNIPILKDEAIKLAKKENDKRYIKYVNDIYGDKNKITYREFVKKAIPKPGAEWELNPHETDYQTTQRLMPSESRNKTLNVFQGWPINTAMHKFWDKNIQRGLLAILRVFYTSHSTQADEALNAIAHQVALRMKDYMFDDDRIKGFDDILFNQIIVAISRLKRQDEDMQRHAENGGDKLGNKIWWGNRDMINEEVYTLLTMLKEER